MRWCWMTWFREGKCSRLPAQHKKMTFDEASVCVQWKYREWKYQKINEVGGLAYRFSGVQSSSEEQSSWDEYNREKRGCTVSVNQWATNEEKQDEEKCGPFFEILRTRRATLFWTFCSLFTRYWGQPKRRELKQSRRERTKAETRVFVASVNGRWRMELMQRSSKLAERTRLETWVFIIKWQ